MIEIYSYYSIGGYKDLYLGNTEDVSSSVFFSPLLELWENGEKFDESTNSQLRDLATRPRIVQITKENRQKLPNTAILLETKGGYKCLLASTENGYSLIIREIENSSKDEYGRPIPFLLHFLGKDIDEMSTLAKYACEKRKEFETTLSKLFHYNPLLNALEFNLGVINAELKRIIEEESKEENIEELRLPQYTIKYLMVADPSRLMTVTQIMGIRTSQIYKVYGPNGRSRKINPIEYAQRQEPAVPHNNCDSNLPVFDVIKTLLSKFIITKEDEEDLHKIKELIIQIINRKK